MKKITLILAAAMIAVSGMAQPFAKIHHNPGVLKLKKEMKAKAVRSGKKTIAMQEAVQKKNLNFKALKEKADVELDKSYFDADVYTFANGMYLDSYMNEGAYLLDGDKVYVQPWTILDAIEGKVVQGKNIFSDKYEADSIEINNDVVVGELQVSETETAEVSFAKVGFDDDSNPVKEDGVIGGWVFDNGDGTYDMIIKDCIGLFVGDELIASFHWSYFAPADVFDGNMHKATISGMSGKTLSDPNTEYENADGAAVLAYGGIYVRGISPSFPDAWTFLKCEFDEEGYLDADAGASLGENQYLGTRILKNGTIVDVTTSSLDDQYIFAKAVEFFIDGDDDENLVLESTGDYIYSEYYFASQPLDPEDEDSDQGFWDYLSSPKIVISQDLLAIKGITDNVKSQTAGSKQAYNLAGQKVGNNYKGIVIKNGKKYLKK